MKDICTADGIDALSKTNFADNLRISESDHQSRTEVSINSTTWGFIGLGNIGTHEQQHRMNDLGIC